jgi:hypothetical protein
MDKCKGSILQFVVSKAKNPVEYEAMMKAKEESAVIQRARVAVLRGKDYLEQERLRKLRLAAARAKKFCKVHAKPCKASKETINIVLGDGLTRFSVEEDMHSGGYGRAGSQHSAPQAAREDLAT